MGLGIPPVVSPVGANATLVRNGENGFLASSPAEWTQALDRLLSEPELRRRLGDAARATVEQDFSAETQAPRLARILRDLASQ